MSETKKLGFIGCGLMGHGMAKNLLMQGHAMTIFDHPGNQPIDDLLEMGAKTAATAKDTVAEADVVFICVTGAPQVEAIVFGDDGLLDGLSEGTIIVDGTTTDPGSTLKVAAAIEAKGGRYMDAPMTRTPKEAEEGRLNVLMGGDEDTIAEVRPLLEAYGENFFFGGPVSSGHRMKLLHNFISLGTSVLLAEAYTVAGKGGVDRNVLTEVLATGGGDSVVLKRLIPFIEEGDASGFMFSMINACKDMRYLTHMAEDLQVAAPVAESLHQTFITAANVGGNERLVPELVDILGGMHGAPLCKK